MRSSRVVYWLGGLVAVIMISAVMQGRQGWPDSAPFQLFLAWGFVGLGGEVVALIRTVRASRDDEFAIPPRSADGRVELVPLPDALTERNEFDPRFGRFVGWRQPDTQPAPASWHDRQCPRLRGQVVWVSLFIGRDGFEWSEEEVASGHEVLFKAASWLEREAQRWNAPVNVQLASTYFVSSDDNFEDAIEVTLVTHGNRFAPADAHEPIKLLGSISRAVAKLGFRDAVDWVSQVDSRLEGDVRVWLVHLRRAGCSQVVSQDGTEIGTVRFALCHARESIFPERLRGSASIDPVTVVHETLHLFDASDKYDVPLSSFPAKTVSSRDVMRLSQSRLSQLRIDARTAAEIGWI